MGAVFQEDFASNFFLDFFANKSVGEKIFDGIGDLADGEKTFLNFVSFQSLFVKTADRFGAFKDSDVWFFEGMFLNFAHGLGKNFGILMRFLEGFDLEFDFVREDFRRNGEICFDVFDLCLGEDAAAK